MFDFFGTLTDPAEEPNRRAAYDRTARALSVGPDEFWVETSRSFDDRATGVFGGTRETLRSMAERCGGTPSELQLDRAVAIHLAGARELQSPRPGAVEVVTDLTARGFRLGLLSDCSSELCELWPSSPFEPFFDAAVFSWEQGHRKPDPRGFARAARLLDVAPEACWFVGDGGSGELAGALAAGMRPVLVTDAAHPDHRDHQYDRDDFVPADSVEGILGIPDLITGHP